MCRCVARQQKTYVDSVSDVLSTPERQRSRSSQSQRMLPPAAHAFTVSLSVDVCLSVCHVSVCLSVCLSADPAVCVCVQLVVGLALRHLVLSRLLFL